LSAIFGLIRWHGDPIERDSLERMDRALAQHGPDGGGIWREAGAGLGHRLMRFTPQDGLERQPRISVDGSRVLVCDARIDNRHELAAELEACRPSPAGPSPDDRPDSDLLLRAYEVWGPECVGHLVGVFAFAIWDRQARRLFAARSPVVAPMLMYHATERSFAFATAPCGLHALPDVPRALDERRLAEMLVMRGDSSSFRTLYLQISRLPTGHTCHASAQGIKIECFWRPDPRREIRYRRDEEYIAAFGELFERVVGDHLRGTSKVAVQLSGGLDSSAVAATAARLLAPRGERLIAFTEVPAPGFAGKVPRGWYADETPLVEAIAARIDNLDLNLMRTEGQFFLDGLDRLFPHLEAPFRNTANRVWMEAILRETARRGIKVLLDGMQGNLTMSWNGSGLLPGLIRAGKWGQYTRQARTAHAFWRTLAGQVAMPLLPGPLRRAVEGWRGPASRAGMAWRALSPIHPGFAAAQRIPEWARERGDARRARAATDSRQSRTHALASQDLGGYIGAYRAMFGVDRRSPPADVRLAEFCLALPEEQFLQGGVPRSLLRRAMAASLPETVLANRMRGMQAADWFARLIGARGQIAVALSGFEQSDLASRMLDLPRMRRLFERLPDRAEDHDGQLREYQQVFSRGLMIGSFLRWFEAGNRR